MQSDIVQRLKDEHAMNGGQGAYAWQSRELCGKAAAELARLTSQLRAAEEREKALREVLAEISDLHGEINPCNYDNDDACELNRQFCYALTISSAALKEQPHADA